MSETSPAPHAPARTEPGTSTPVPQELYREKLVPSVGSWVFVVAFGLSCFGVAAPINIALGVVVGVVLAAVLGLILYAGAPVIRVTTDAVQVGRAHIEREFVGRVESFRGDAARKATGPWADGRAYMCFRPWVSPVVRLEITDPADPTPYWLANSRHPERLAELLDPQGQQEGAQPSHSTQ